MKKIFFSFLTLALVVPGPVLAFYQANSSATVVVGQQHLNYIPGSYNGGLANQGDITKGLNHPSSIYSDGTRLFVADSFNNRVLIYNEIPTSNNATPDVVIGQPDLYANAPNNGGIGSNTLYNPISVYATSSKLFIADYSNSRVLIYNEIPTEDGASADVVVGQPDMESNAGNQGGDVGANTLYMPASVYSDGTRLFVADYRNNRVLIYNEIPTGNGANADVVIGQAGKTTNTSNYGGLSNKSLSYPFSVSTANEKLIINDYNNYRVLIYNSVPESDYAPANVVVGQAAMNTRTSGTTAAKIKLSLGAYSDGTRLFIGDYYNNRVLIYNSLPTENGVSADVVIGQDDMTSKSANQGGNVGANTLYYPYGAYSDGTRLFVADCFNNRVLIYNEIPTEDGASADVVIGQEDFIHNNDNQSIVGAKTLNYPEDVFSDGTRLFIADDVNHRVLIYNEIPTEDGASADVVVGQPDMESNAGNQGGSVGANTLYQPDSVYATSSKLFITDYYNNRVLIYNEIPTEDGASADVVIGQADFTHSYPNRGTSQYESGDVGANTLYFPTDVFSDGTRLFIADYSNSRVLIYNEIPTEDGASADVVVGQPDMESNAGNQGGDVGANTLYMPASVYSDGTRLFITDTENNRVLIYNEIPTENNASADVVVGQEDLVTANWPDEATANNTGYANGVTGDGTRLYIVDSAFNRILIYNTIPTENGASADAVIGQADFTSSDTNQGGNVGANTLRLNWWDLSPSVSHDKLFVADAENNRVLIYPLGPQNTSASAPSQTSQQTINLTLSSDDAKEMMISEHADFSNAGWQTYQSTITHAFDTNQTGNKTVYVKFRDYANYESATYALAVNYNIPGGGGFSPSFNSPPAAPANTNQTGSSSGFKININNQAPITTTRTVKITFTTGSDTTRVALSEDPNFYLSPLQDLKPEMDFLLSPGNGSKTIYAKFYTQYGYASEPVSASITLNGQTSSSTLQSLAPTPSSNYVAKLIKYPDNPTVYLINQNNEKQPFYNALAFTERNHQWSAIEVVNPTDTWPTGETLYSTNQTEQVQSSWNPPSGYQYISSPSQFPNYFNIISEPNSPRKYGLPKGTTTSNTYQFKNYLYYGLKDNKEVKFLQELLKTLGYLTGIINWPGTYDSATVKAVRALQKEHNITPNTGTVGPKTRAVLNGM